MTDRWTNKHTYEQKDENYIPLSINARGITIYVIEHTSSDMAPSSLCICSTGFAGLVSVTASAIDRISFSVSASDLLAAFSAELAEGSLPVDPGELLPSFVEELAVLLHNVRTWAISDFFLLVLRLSWVEQGCLAFCLTIWHAKKSLTGVNYI